MKALVFSDSHGRLDNLMKAVDRNPEYQAIFHLGDIGNDAPYLRSITPYPVYIVRGNCDYCSNLKESMVVEFGGKRIAMCHGNRYMGYGEGTDALRYFGLQEQADIVMFGHTHVPLLEDTGEIILLNPGSISKPRQDDRIPTYTVMEIDEDGNIKFHMRKVN